MPASKEIIGPEQSIDDMYRELENQGYTPQTMIEKIQNFQSDLLQGVESGFDRRIPYFIAEKTQEGNNTVTLNTRDSVQKMIDGSLRMLQSMTRVKKHAGLGNVLIAEDEAAMVRNNIAAYRKLMQTWECIGLSAA